jgi:hypothetical protein
MGFLWNFGILIGVLNGQWEFGHLETSVIGILKKTVVEWNIFELWPADVQCKTWLSDLSGCTKGKGFSTKNGG